MTNTIPKLNASAALLLQRSVEAGITSPNELANIMGNAQVETGGFSTMYERFNYSSADRLIASVSSATHRFSRQQIEEAVASQDPQKIATILYENRPKIGNTHPGDGWRYRGRGYFQYTGRDNYAQFGKRFGVDLEGNPDLAAEPEIAAKLAIAYWKVKINPAIRDNVEAAAKIINGGPNGGEARVLASRQWQRVITPQLVAEVLCGKAIYAGQLTANRHAPPQGHRGSQQSKGNESIDSGRHHVLHQGGTGSPIHELQQVLSRLGYRDGNGHPLAIDGILGPHTRHAIEQFQREHGLHVDGVVGKDTLAMLARTQANPFTNQYHPHHKLYEQALRGVHVEESRRHIASGEHSERLAGALTVAAVRDGLVRIDRVELNTPGSLARAVQVSPIRDERGLNRDTQSVATAEALQQPLHHSSEHARQLSAVQKQQQQSMLHEQHAPQYRHAGPVLAR